MIFKTEEEQNKYGFTLQEIKIVLTVVMEDVVEIQERMILDVI